MKPFTPVYVPVGVPTFHMLSAEDAFAQSKDLLHTLEPGFVFRQTENPCQQSRHCHIKHSQCHPAHTQNNNYGNNLSVHNLY